MTSRWRVGIAETKTSVNLLFW